MVDLLTFTYQILVPKIKDFNPPKKQKVQQLMDESSLEALLAKEGDLVSIASEIGNRVEDITILFKAKVFLSLLESEKITVSQASKAISFLTDLKILIADLDTNSAVDDFISNLDVTISDAGIEEIFQWANLIKSIPTSLGRHDSFIPMLGIRLKTLIWNKISTSNMNSIIELATILFKCISYKDLELNDLVEIVVDHCADYIETINDFHGIEAQQGNPVNADLPGTRRLLGFLKQFDIVNKDLKLRISALINTYTAEEPNLKKQEDIRLNVLANISEVRLTDRILYSHNDVVKGLDTVVREGILGTGVKVAVKIYTAKNPSNLNSLVNEANFLRLLSGQKRCFLTFYGDFLVGNSFYIVTELCDRSLYEDTAIRKSTNKPYTIDECLDIMNQLLEGFIFMNHNKIYHQDIKPQNIMFIDKLTVKIIDFNVVIRADNIESTNSTTGTYTIQGTRGFMSPEVLAFYLANVGAGNQKHSYKLSKADVFSLGLVFLGLFTFDELTGLNQAIRNAELLDKVRSVVSDNCCRELIFKMLNVNPQLRPSFNKALAELPGKTTKMN